MRKPLQFFKGSPHGYRVVPGAPEQSALLFRMRERSPQLRMPPLASEQPDPEGTALVRAWIASLPAE